MATLILTDEFKKILEKQETIDALNTKGYNADFLEEEIQKRLNKFDSSLNLKSISYHILQDSDTYIGIILDEYLDKLYNICIIPPVLGTRSGFLSQQIFGFVSNLINGQRTKDSFTICDKPVIIVNCLVGSLANSSICNIIGSKIIGFHYIDIFDRDEDFGNSNFNLKDFVSTISQHKDVSKDIDLSSDTLTLKTQRLKDFSTSLTNEPYYFAITAYPAVILAKKEGYMIDITDFEEKFKTGKSNKNINAFLKFVKEIKTVKSEILTDQPLQQIYYGAPGTGKSCATNKVTSKYPDTVRTTFHPDSDYSTFVGAYKPTTTSVPRYGLNGNNTVSFKDENDKVLMETNIEYKFVKQAFLKAYVKAWKKFAETCVDGGELAPQFLVIEEINRGNCAQIFGDLFQLLDRKENFSEYPIEADTDICKALLEKDEEGNPSFGTEGLTLSIEQKAYVNSIFDKKGEASQQVAEKICKGEVLVLPPNFYIWATMNTSDQSLFPMDAAFKRRWDWKYVPVNHVDASKFKVKIGDSYSLIDWDKEIITPLNSIIKDITKSDDKQIGNRFVKVRESQKAGDFYIISKEQFVNKVMFYLWSEIFKDYTENDSSLFMKDDKHFSFDDLFEFDKEGKNVEIIDEYVLAFIENIKEYKVKGEDIKI